MKYFVFDADSQVGSAVFSEFKTPGDFFYGTLSGSGLRVSPFVKLLDLQNPLLLFRTVLSCDVSFAQLSPKNAPVIRALLDAAADRHIDNAPLLVLVGTSTDFFSCSNPKLRILRVNCGLIYGHGEHALFDVFTDAWHGRPVPSSPSSPSSPSDPDTGIHAVDLVRAVKRAVAGLVAASVDTPPPAVTTISVKDATTSPVSLAAVAAAAFAFMAGVAEPPSQPQQPPQAGADEQPEEQPQADPPALAAAEDDDTQPSGHCLAGPVVGVATLVAEFVRLRGLRPLRIAVLGSGASEDVSVCDQLAALYGLPLLLAEKDAAPASIRSQVDRHRASRFRGYVLLLQRPSEATLDALLGGETGESRATEALPVDVVLGVSGDLATAAALPRSLSEKWDVPVFDSCEQDKSLLLDKLAMFVGRSAPACRLPTAQTALAVAAADGRADSFSENRLSQRLTAIAQIRAQREELRQLDLRTYLMEVCVPGMAHALDTLRRRKADADADSDAAQLALLADALSNYCES